jgi:hypothetical protein
MRNPFLAAVAHTPVAANNPLAARASLESTLYSSWLTCILAIHIRLEWARLLVAAR